MDQASSGSADPRLAALLERAARYQERTVVLLRKGRRADGTLTREVLERAIAELSSAIDCLREANELSEGALRTPLEETLRQREEERRSLEALLRRRG